MRDPFTSAGDPYHHVWCRGRRTLQIHGLAGDACGPHPWRSPAGRRGCRKHRRPTLRDDGCGAQCRASRVLREAHWRDVCGSGCAEAGGHGRATPQLCRPVHLCVPHIRAPSAVRAYTTLPLTLLCGPAPINAGTDEHMPSTRHALRLVHGHDGRPSTIGRPLTLNARHAWGCSS